MDTTTVKRDVSLRPVGPGTYILTQPGQRSQMVTVFEDEDSTDLFIRSKVHGQEVSQRIDELAEDVCFHRVQSGEPIKTVGWSMVADLGTLMNDAAASRQHLRLIEDEMNHLLGSQTGDGSELSEAVMAAVRDGVGSAIELADLAGKLRR